MFLSNNANTDEADKRQTLRRQSFGVDGRVLPGDPLSLDGSPLHLRAEGGRVAGIEPSASAS